MTFLISLAPNGVVAQNYPSKPVRIIVGSGTGSPDTTSRILAQQLGTQMGRAFFVENKPGAGGVIGADLVTKSAPDGYTLLVSSGSIAVNPSIYESMPYDSIRGVVINFEVLGKDGPWVALSAGGRRGMEAVASIAKSISAAGYRVLIHDRRNCGASQVSIEGDGSEYDIWADDLNELLRLHDALPAWVGGSSSGCRLALTQALRHRSSVRGLLPWRVTGDAFESRRFRSY